MVLRHSCFMPWGLLTALSLGLAIAPCVQPLPAQAQEQQTRVVTVTGQGIVNIPTSLTQVQLGVEIRGKTAEQVQQDAAQRSNAVVELLKSRNVEKLQTTGIRLNPLYDYRNDRQELVGYIATNTVSFQLKTGDVGTLLDDAVRAGATQINGISFIANETELVAAQRQALQLATQDAQRQADAVLEVLNLTRREVINIQVNGASAPPPVQFDVTTKLRGEVAFAAAPTPVIGGEQTVQASVTLQIRY
ncbi:MAG: SIMPL domain-containing protein [Microcoleaceae cyanobacterium]